MEDESAIEKLMRETAMGENIRVTMRRDGGYFTGAHVQCEEPLVYGIFDENGRVFGAYAAGKRRVWVDGEVQDLRYLSDLRIHPDLRGRRWLFRGYRHLANEMKGDFAQSLILSDNRAVMNMLTSERAGLPKYHPAGEYVSYFFGVGKRCAPKKNANFRVAKPTDAGAMQELYDEQAQRFQFAPVLNFSALETSPYFAGVGWNDLFLAWEGEKLVAMFGLWDQSAYKQLVVESYSLPMQTFRPFSALVSDVPLPKVGQAISCKTVTMPACTQGNEQKLDELLQWARSTQPRGILLMLGLDARDPRRQMMTGIRCRTEHGRHFLVGEVPDFLLKSEKPFIFDLARV